MTYEEASGFWETSQTDFEYDEAMCAAMPEPSMGKIQAKKVFLFISTYIVDVLWGQRIKLIQVASNSELRENQWKDHLFFEIVPSHCFGASEASKIDCLKN